MATRDLVIKAFAQELEKTPDEVASAASLSELGVESLEMVQVIMSLEEDLSITLSDRDLQEVRSLDDLVALIDKTLAEGSAAKASVPGA